jgi:hypothetical protein
MIVMAMTISQVRWWTPSQMAAELQCGELVRARALMLEARRRT